ncbi:MAG: hypothetical protein AAFY26_02140 [Cyanobacteria bacterium J06638_22]
MITLTTEEQDLIDFLAGKTLAQAATKYDAALPEGALTLRDRLRETLVPPKGESFTERQRALLREIWMEIPSLVAFQAFIDKCPDPHRPIIQYCNQSAEHPEGFPFTPSKPLTDCLNPGDSWGYYAPYYYGVLIMRRGADLSFPPEEPMEGLP